MAPYLPWTTQTQPCTTIHVDRRRRAALWEADAPVTTRATAMTTTTIQRQEPEPPAEDMPLGPEREDDRDDESIDDGLSDSASLPDQLLEGRCDRAREGRFGAQPRPGQQVLIVLAWPLFSRARTYGACTLSPETGYEEVMPTVNVKVRRAC